LSPPDPDRRRVIAYAGAIAVLPSPTKEENKMYGLIGQMIATPGHRAELAEILLAGTKDMPGCRSHVIAEDLTNPDALWITEVWDSQELHGASLQLPGVQAAIARGRPLIAGFGSRTETRPLG
jgi:quinol monooxygenase YgiN